MNLDGVGTRNNDFNQNSMEIHNFVGFQHGKQRTTRKIYEFRWLLEKQLILGIGRCPRMEPAARHFLT